jgi:hypothetical protein
MTSSSRKRDSSVMMSSVSRLRKTFAPVAAQIAELQNADREFFGDDRRRV